MKSSTFFQKILYFIFLIAANLNCISIVYNLKIAETTKRQVKPQFSKYLKPSIGAGALVNQFRRRYDGTKQLVEAGLATLLTSSHKAYLRVDFAAGYVKEKNDLTCFSRSQTDDILFSFGYTEKIRNHTNLTWSGFLGFPTHQDTAFQGFELGTGHIGAGTQLDTSWSHGTKNNHMLLAAARFLHFFHRNTCVPTIKKAFDFSPGNLADLYIAHKSSFGRHSLECGYNPSFAFSANICPPLSIVQSNALFIRSSFYVSYSHIHIIKRLGLASGFLTGFSYAFDHNRQPLTLKKIMTLWLSWGINF